MFEFACVSRNVTFLIIHHAKIGRIFTCFDKSNDMNSKSPVMHGTHERLLSAIIEFCLPEMFLKCVPILKRMAWFGKSPPVCPHSGGDPLQQTCSPTVKWGTPGNAKLNTH